SFIVIGSEEAGPFAAAEVFINGESVGTVVTDGETVLEWSSAEPGIFHAYAVAFNEEEQSFRSATIEVRVVYSEGIAFSFGELPESTILGDPVSLSVEMAEEDAIPFQVEYLVDGEAIATVSEEPFEHIWIAETP